MFLRVILCLSLIGRLSLTIQTNNYFDGASELFEIYNNANDVPCSKFQFVSINSSAKFDGHSWTNQINCSYKNLFPLELNWHYLGKRLQSEASMNFSSNVKTQILTVNNFTEKDVGLYTCLAIGCPGLDDVSVWLDASPVVKVNVSDENPLAVGSVLQGTCIGYLNSTLIWLPFDRLNGTGVEVVYSKDKFGNSISNVTFAVNELDNLLQLQCCIIPQRFDSLPFCTPLQFKVIGKPKLITYRSYSAGDSFSVLSCTFATFAFPQRIDWSVCLFDEPHDCVFVANGTQTNITDKFIQANYSVDASLNNIYTCWAVDVDGRNASHTFNITGMQIAPQFISSNVTVNQTSSGIEIIFECLFMTEPPPQIYWLKKGKFNNITMLIPDDSRITINNITTNFSSIYLTLLTIRSFSPIDYGTYFCMAANDYGTASSLALYSSLNTASVKVISSKSSNTFEVGEEVRVSCFIEGAEFPHSYIRMIIVNENDLSYSVVKGKGFANVSFIGDVMNNHVKVKCEAFNVFTHSIENVKDEAVIFINHNAELIDNHTCSPEDFANGSSCELVCTIRRSPNTLLKQHEWIYFSFVGNHSYYFLRESQSFIKMGVVDNFTIGLSTYYAGHYQCLVTYYDPIQGMDIISNVFKINLEEDGSRLTEDCEDATQCLAYNAVCKDEIDLSSKSCQCELPLNIPMALNLSTSACVGVAAPGEMCYNNIQCQSYERNFNCTDYFCQCDGFLVQVDELDGNYSCRSPVEFGDACLYNIDCQLYDAYSWCNDFVCSCVEGYYYKDFLETCGRERVLSKGAIAGIVIGLVAAVTLLIFFITFGRSRWRFRRNRLLSSQHLALDSSELEDDMDFPHFNSFSQFPVIEDET